MQKELIYISLIVCTLLPIGWTGCQHADQSGRELPSMRVKTQVVETEQHGTTFRYVGTIEPIQEVRLSMQIPGRLVALHVHTGERVHEGQAILSIDSTQAVHARISAESALRQASDAYDRVRKVHDKGAVTDQKMIEIESQLTRTQALYDAAVQQVNECTLTAPFQGVITNLDIQEGQMVTPAVPLCTIMDTRAFEVKFTVPETEVKGLMAERLSGVVECVAADTILPIRIQETNISANPLTHTYDVKARIEGGREVLMSGMVGKVTVTSDRLKVKERIVIPAQCILLVPEGHTVWIRENGQATRRFITIGGYEADGIEVLSGLEAGDTLITEGYQKLYNGCKVICDM